MSHQVYLMEDDLSKNFKAELLSLTAAHPEHQQIIVKAYKSLFPSDTWINILPSDF